MTRILVSHLAYIMLQKMILYESDIHVTDRALC